MHKVQRVNHVQKIITIDSGLRTAGTESNFDIDVNMPKSNAFNKCSVVMAEMFKSWYTLDDTTTNTFTVNVNSGGEIPMTLTSGLNYDSSTFALALTVELDATFSGMVAYVEPLDGKLYITHPSLTFTVTASDELAKYMGMVSGSTISAVLDPNPLAPPGQYIAVGTNVVNMQRYDVLFIKATGIQNNNDNVILRLFPSGVGNFGTFGFSNFDSVNNAVTVENSSFNSMHFSVQDKFNKNVNMNGVNWRMALTFYNSED